MNEEYKEIIDNCNNFLNKSSARYSNTILRAIDDMRRYSGDFWTDEYKKTYQRSKRVNLSLNNWNPMVNAISSPISNSPWHIELTNDNMSDLQEMIDQIENDNDSK